MGKRYFDDSQVEALKTIGLTIYHLGDQHPSFTPEEDLQNTLKMIMDERKDCSEEIVASIIAS